MSAPQDDLDALIHGAKNCPPVAPAGHARAGWDRLRGSLGAAVIMPQIDVPPGLVESAIVGKSATAATVAGWSWVGKAIASAAVTLTVGGIGVATSGIATRDASAVPRAVVAPTTPSPAALAIAPAELPAPQPAITATTLATQHGTPLAASTVAPPVGASIATRTASAEPEPSAKRRVTKTGAEAEAPLIAAAMRALVEGDATAALRELDRHRRLHPSGSMTEDREALRVSALCKAGRTVEATKLRNEFLTKWPSSPHASRVRAACTAG